MGLTRLSVFQLYTTQSAQSSGPLHRKSNKKHNTWGPSNRIHMKKDSDFKWRIMFVSTKLTFKQGDVRSVLLPLTTTSQWITYQTIFSIRFRYNQEVKFKLNRSPKICTIGCTSKLDSRYSSLSFLLTFRHQHCIDKQWGARFQYHNPKSCTVVSYLSNTS